MYVASYARVRQGTSKPPHAAVQRLRLPLTSLTTSQSLEGQLSVSAC